VANSDRTSEVTREFPDVSAMPRKSRGAESACLLLVSRAV
jgi:hypothetical protein